MSRFDATDRDTLKDEVQALSCGVEAVVVCAKQWGWTREDVHRFVDAVWELAPLKRKKRT